MKIIFFGTSGFAVASLKALAAARHKISAVVTAADKQKGRGQKLKFSPLKVLAREKGLALFQPQDLRDERFIQQLKAKSADLFAVCDYGKILTKELLQLPKKYAINLHASLLPKYRGAAPINWTIINGDSHSGVTVFKMNEYLDSGEIILQTKVSVSAEDTALTLRRRLARAGAQLLLQSVDLIERGAINFIAQDESRASLAPKLKKADGLINWLAPALSIHNRIRGLLPWPGAFTYLRNRLFKVWQAKVVPEAKAAEPGEILALDKKNGILVQTGKGQLWLTLVQIEGKKKMPAVEFILGHNLKVGEKFGRIK